MIIRTAIVSSVFLLAVAGCEREPETPQVASAEAEEEQTRAAEAGAAGQAPPEAEDAAPAHFATSEAEQQLAVDPGASNPTPVTRAIAVLSPTDGNEASGTVTFTEGPEGLNVEADVTGLEPGKHAYHVHLLGDCSSPDGKSAGTHFNFEGSSKNPPDDIQRITGNLGDLEAAEDGKATAEATIAEAVLQGPYSIVGRSVVIHTKPNDPSQPPIGGAGDRVACGVIGIDEKA